MKELRYHELAKLVETAAQTCSSLYLEEGDAGLTEDLIQGFMRYFRPKVPVDYYGITKADELIRELDTRPDGRAAALVVRTYDRLFTSDNVEAILMRLDRERLNARLRVVFVGPRPADRVREWFTENRAYGVVTEPTFEKLGHWMVAKTAKRWDYTRPAGPIDVPTGLRLMEHVGWDYTAALQAAETIRSYGFNPSSWELVSALVPPKAGAGYVDALVFGTGRRGAYRLAEGITGDQLLKTLGMVRWHLRMFAKLRASEVGKMTPRAVEAETGLHAWRWEKKYKPVFASYTHDRIRMRMGAVEQAMQAARAGATTAVLEVLVAEW